MTRKGADWLALAGAESLLARAAIDAVFLEVHWHSPYVGPAIFGEIKAVLSGHRYRLYGMYDLVREGNGRLDCCNALLTGPAVYAGLGARYLF